MDNTLQCNSNINNGEQQGQIYVHIHLMTNIDSGIIKYSDILICASIGKIIDSCPFVDISASLKKYTSIKHKSDCLFKDLTDPKDLTKWYKTKLKLWCGSKSTIKYYTM